MVDVDEAALSDAVSRIELAGGRALAHRGDVTADRDVGASGLDPYDPTGEAGRALLTDMVPMARYGTPEEVARVALMLASPAASYVNGAVWRVDGGQVS